uniref:Ig-like domain-containing protein n=1 Tax=Pavo cristatus TaxID=9049 RepID=A0A8C9FX25_PAVCR
QKCLCDSFCRSPSSVQLSCQGYGFSFESDIVQWYRQAPGSRIKWLSTFVTSSDTIFSHEVEGRATASQDDSQALSFLSLHDLFPQDTARYFCAVRTGTGNLTEL